MPFFLRSVSLWLAAILAIPTFLILLTWNSLPGQRLYPIKRGLEEGPRLAFHLAGVKTAADYEVFIADRRFSEATNLVKNNDTAGLVELQTSIQQTKNTIITTQNNQAKQKFVDNLIAYNQKLEQEKSTLTGNLPPPATAVSQTPQPAANPAQPSPTQPTTTANPNSSPAQPTPVVQPTTTTTTTTVATTTPAPTQTVADITTTQNKIKQVINELEKEDRKESRSEKNKKDDKENDRQNGSKSGQRNND